MHDVDAGTTWNTVLVTFRSVRPHGDLLVASVDEGPQGADLNADGDLLDSITFVLDPRLEEAVNLGALHFDGTAVAPIVLSEDLFEGPVDGPRVWLFDPRQNLLRPTALLGVARGVVGKRVVVFVSEEVEGVDLDANGVLDSVVPALLDPTSARFESLGIDAEGLLSAGKRMLLASRESAARRDWNEDGDLDDSVLFLWDEGRGRLANTRLENEGVVLTEELAFLGLTLSGVGAPGRTGESEGLRVLDLATGGLTTTGLAGALNLSAVGRRALFLVPEADQGSDLNGDGDLEDFVLHWIEVGG